MSAGSARAVPGSERSLTPALDERLLLACIHCGLCTSSCPTYLETGSEADSPRGRIYLMRAVTEGKLDSADPAVGRHLDLCLDCRACESACPSGVKYGRLIESFREQQSSPDPSVLELALSVTPRPRLLSLLVRLGTLARGLGVEQAVRSVGLWELLPRSLRDLNALIPARRRPSRRLPGFLPAKGRRRARVALFVGCAGHAFFPETTWSTARVLQRNGCDVVVPPRQGCCGALHYHAGYIDDTRDFAMKNVLAFGPLFAEGLDAVIVSAAGCGAMLKDYDRIINGQYGGSLAAKTRDVTEFLAELGIIPPEHPLAIRAVYHDACHLCHAQQIREQPRQLLGMIKGLELVPLTESELCCGAAGSYNLQQPDMAERLGRRKADRILATQARAVFAANVGCLLQIGRYLRDHNLWIAHPVDALWAAYRGVVPGQAR